MEMRIRKKRFINQFVIQYRYSCFMCLPAAGLSFVSVPPCSPSMSLQRTEFVSDIHNLASLRSPRQIRKASQCVSATSVALYQTFHEQNLLVDIYSHLYNRLPLPRADNPLRVSNPDRHHPPCIICRRQAILLLLQLQSSDSRLFRRASPSSCQLVIFISWRSWFQVSFLRPATLTVVVHGFFHSPQ